MAIILVQNMVLAVTSSDRWKKAPLVEGIETHGHAQRKACLCETRDVCSCDCLLVGIRLFCEIWPKISALCQCQENAGTLS